MKADTSPPQLMLVTDRHRTGGRDLAGLVLEAVRGGLGFIQLREKDLSAPAFEALAGDLHERLPRGVTFAVNGHPDLALRRGWGLHVPAGTELPPMGREAWSLLGRSVHSSAETRDALRDRPDYLVLGTMYRTSSKPGLVEPSGPALLARVREVLAAGASPPFVYAIGGITVTRVAEVVREGADGVAVTAAILEAPDPARATEELLEALNRARVAR